jgi:hypothetical protein
MILTDQVKGKFPRGKDEGVMIEFSLIIAKNHAHYR